MRYEICTHNFGYVYNVIRSFSVKIRKKILHKARSSDEDSLTVTYVFH